jgi:hypothetical protein
MYCFKTSMGAPQVGIDLGHVLKLRIGEWRRPLCLLNPPILRDFEWVESPPELGGWGAARALKHNLGCKAAVTQTATAVGGTPRSTCDRE